VCAAWPADCNPGGKLREQILEGDLISGSTRLAARVPVAIGVVSFRGQTGRSRPMKIVVPTIPFVVLALAAPAFAADAPAAAKKPGKAEAFSVNASDIKWDAAPPDLPKGAEMTVLHGDPTKKGVFTARVKMPTGYKIPPHWHSRDEQLTVVAGSFVLHMGDTMDAPATTLAAVGFHFLPAKSHHAAEASEETIVQIDGMGPFDIHYLNPADNPNPKNASAAKKTAAP
jgi:quercetin dioxygenase-like cupin family protein